MPFDPDDPRITAYALGEIDDAEKSLVEARIAEDSDAQALIAEIRATALMLTEHLRAEPVPVVGPRREATDCEQIIPKPAPARRTGRWLAVGAAVAAGTLGLWFTFHQMKSSRPRSTNSFAESDFVLAQNQPARNLPQPDRPQSAEMELLQSADPAVHAAREPVPLLARARRPESINQLSNSLSPESRLFDGSSRVKSNRFGENPSSGKNNTSVPGMGGMVGGMAGAGGGMGGVGGGMMGGMDADPTAAPLAAAPAGPAPPLIANPGRFSFRGTGLGRSSDGRNDAPTLAKPTSTGPVATLDGRPFLSTSADGRLIAGRKLAEGAKTDSRALLLDKTPTMAGAMVQEFGLVDGPGKAKRAEVSDELPAIRRQNRGGDAFQPIVENSFLRVAEAPVSTFSIDVDTASYANVRRFLTQGVRPPADAVRIEELLNYFTYQDPEPKGDEPFSANIEIARCPWSADHRLARIGLKGRGVADDKRPPSNLVFLIDVSGSMKTMDRLPLLKAGMKLLVDALGEDDSVAIVVYAGSEGLALPPTSCSRKAEILSTIDQLEAGGSTNGGKGIVLAYDLAVRHFIKGGTNRVILATDGDFNVGITSREELDRLVEARRQSNVFLSVLGFGQGNVRHDQLESLADKGNGQYFYIDTLREARKVLVEQMGGTLVAIAKDVKIQVEFNPETASSYRLIGYENRMLRAQDFADDAKDAGEIGAGISVTALYEIVPVNRFQAGPSGWLMDFRLRFKAPEGGTSRLIERRVVDDRRDFAAASDDFKFASAVAGFGMMLRDSAHKGNLSWPAIEELAAGAAIRDRTGYRPEFLGLVRKAASLPPR